MIEFMVVDHPAVHPNCCVICGSGKGPIVDTHVEKWGDHLYLCRLCVTRAARVYGLVKGPKMDELLAAADSLDEKDRQLAVLKAENDELRLANGGHRRRLNEMKEQIEQSAGTAQAMGLAATELERIARVVVELAGQTSAEALEAAVA